MKPQAVVSGLGVDEHPAVQAWRELGAGHARPVAVELRKHRRKSDVYRLRGAGPRGATVVAKYCQNETAAVESVIYEEILPQLDISALRCYGSVPGRDGGCWLFLEDAGEGRISFEDSAHRRLMARWVARMHLEVVGLPELEHLPDRGAAHYLAQLDEGHQRISAGIRNPALTDDQCFVLRELASLYERLGAGWRSVAAFSSALPPTLVHRDLRRSNVRLRDEPDRERVLVLDWEMAGRGISAVDVVKVDVRTYVDEVRAFWAIDRDNAVRLEGLGVILRNLDAFHWISPQLLQPWAAAYIDETRFYAERLAEGMYAFFGEGSLE